MRYSKITNRLGWVIFVALGVGAVWLIAPQNAFVALGIAVGLSLAGAARSGGRLPNTAWTAGFATAVVTVSLGTLSIVLLSTWGVSPLSTATAGYAIGIVAAWLLITGVSLTESGPFVTLGGALTAVIGTALALLIFTDPLVLIGFLFAGLLAGFVVPLGGMILTLLLSQTNTGRRQGPKQTDPTLRIGIEATAIVSLALAVPFGTRAVALFGVGSLAGYGLGVGVGLLVTLGLGVVAQSQSVRLGRLRDRFVETAYRLVDRLDRWVEARRRRQAERSADPAGDGTADGSNAAVAGGDTADTHSAVDETGVGEALTARLVNHRLAIGAAERLDAAESNAAVGELLSTLRGRVDGLTPNATVSAGVALQLSAAEEAHTQGQTRRAQSLTDAALALAAPPIGAVAQAFWRGQRDGQAVGSDRFGQLLARIDELLGPDGRPDATEFDRDGFNWQQEVLEQLVEEVAGEGFETAFGAIRAAAGDGWLAVQDGDRAVEAGAYGRAITAYATAIRAYVRADEIALEAEARAADTTQRRSTSEKRHSRGDSADATTDDSDELARRYRTERKRLAVALEALLYDTAAVTIAATEQLYGRQPSPTVSPAARRSIVRCLRLLRETQRRLSVSVPTSRLARQRYQHAEIQRSVARVSQQQRQADELAETGSPQAAAERYRQAAERCDVLANRARTAALPDLSKSLAATADELRSLAASPTPAAVAAREPITVSPPDDRRMPGALPAGDRLRRIFSGPQIVELRALLQRVRSHEILDLAAGPSPMLIETIETAISGLDPLYTEPDGASLTQWVEEACVDVLSAATRAVSTRHSRLLAVAREPETTAESAESAETTAHEIPWVALPAAVKQRPEVLASEPRSRIDVGAEPAEFTEQWTPIANEIVAANETIERYLIAVIDFRANAEQLRERLQTAGELDTSQFSGELLELAAHQFTGVAYDERTEQLRRTGPVTYRHSKQHSGITEESTGPEHNATDDTP